MLFRSGMTLSVDFRSTVHKGFWGRARISKVNTKVDKGSVITVLLTDITDLKKEEHKSHINQKQFQIGMELTNAL